MKFILLILAFSCSVFAESDYFTDFPMGPDARITTGSLCSSPIERRYPEQILYCGRNVDTATKNEIFTAYRRLGYVLPSNDRADYKIDHYIPLCMGGSNQNNNLWPQHVSIYKQTDNLEAAICDKMKAGRMNQADAVKMMKAVKNDLSKLAQAYATLQRL